MRLGRVALALLAGTALGAAIGSGGARAEDVTVNLDALGPEPQKKPAKTPKPAAENAVRSEVVPDPAPMNIGAPQAPKPVQPKIAPKPVVAAPVESKPIPTGEVDFISRTKRAQGVQESPVPALPKPKPVAAPVMAAPVPDEQQSAPIAVAPAVMPAKPATPKKKQTPATVVVDTQGLEGQGGAGAKPQGTPLTAIQPDGVLYVPKNVDSLPQPVSVPQPSAPEEADSKPLTLPPPIPEASAAPVAMPVASVKPPAPPAQPAPVQPVPMQPMPAAPQAVQTVAAALPAAAPPERASVLSGQATALELKFEPGLDALTPETQASLDQLAASLKAAGLRVQLAAYSGPPGNNSSEERRLSLKRALAVREYLTAQGVSKLTVNIAAFGGAVQGQTDRVDVMVRTDQLSRLTPVQ
jgi:outer membrane protein OmpA-like peptidoglycan-associated protein